MPYHPIENAVLSHLQEKEDQDIQTNKQMVEPKHARIFFLGHYPFARTESKTPQNIELMTFALTWCANIFVGRSVTPTFFLADRFLF